MDINNNVVLNNNLSGIISHINRGIGISTHSFLNFIYKIETKSV